MANADTDYDLPTLLGTYRKDGSLIREKARVLVEDWLDRIYPRMQDPDTPTSSLLAIGETLIKLGDMAPKAGTGAPAGPAFSITINIPQGDGKDAITITGTAQHTGEPEAPMLDITDFNPLPPKPQWIPVPDFNLNAELSGGLVPGQVPALNGNPLQPPSDAGLAPMGAFAKAVMAPPGGRP